MNTIREMVPVNLLEIADRAHSHAQKAGFLDSDRTSIEKLKDVQKEYMEAFKALNDNHHVDWKRFYEVMHEQGFEIAFRDCVKDTYEQELVDMFMVIVTLMKDREMDIQLHVNCGLEYNSLRGK